MHPLVCHVFLVVRWDYLRIIWLSEHGYLKKGRGSADKKNSCNCSNVYFIFGIDCDRIVRLLLSYYCNSRGVVNMTEIQCVLADVVCCETTSMGTAGPERKRD